MPSARYISSTATRLGLGLYLLKGAAILALSEGASHLGLAADALVALGEVALAALDEPEMLSTDDR